MYDSKILNILNYYLGTILTRKELNIEFNILSRHLKFKEWIKGKIFSRIPIIKKFENNN